MDLKGCVCVMKRLCCAFLCLFLLLSSTVSFAKPIEAGTNYGYGYINQQGDVVITPHWEYATSFLGGTAVVFRGALDEYGYPEEGLYGIIDTQGKPVLKTKWEGLLNFHYDLAAAKKNGKWGYLDRSGNVVIDFQWDYVSSFRKEGIALVFNGTLSKYGAPETGKYGFIDRQGNLLFDTFWEDAYSFDDGVARVRIEGKWGVIKTDGSYLLKPRWDYISPFFLGIATVFKGTLWDFGTPHVGKHGYIDSQGNLFIDAKWDDAGTFGDDLAAVKSGNHYGYINKEGNFVLKPQWFEAGNFYDGRALVCNGEENTLFESYIQQKEYRYIDTQGNIIYENSHMEDARDFSCGYACIKLDGKWGAIDTSGKIAVTPQWDYIADATDDGNFIVFRGTLDIYGFPENGSYGVVSGHGITLVATEWDEIKHLTPHGAAVKKKGQWGLVDFLGNVITSPQWDDIDAFSSNGLAAVVRKEIGYDFKKTNWGMTREEVFALEGTPAETGKTDDAIAWFAYYYTNVADIDAILSYFFCDDGLYKARYIFNEEHSNNDLYLSDYHRIRKLLDEKYGPPLSEEEVWYCNENKQALYEDSKGDAIALGYLAYYVTYELERTTIYLRIYGDNDEISTKITYTCKLFSADINDYADSL